MDTFSLMKYNFFDLSMPIIRLFIESMKKATQGEQVVLSVTNSLPLVILVQHKINAQYHQSKS